MIVHVHVSPHFTSMKRPGCRRAQDNYPATKKKEGKRGDQQTISCSTCSGTCWQHPVRVGSIRYVLATYNRVVTFQFHRNKNPFVKPFHRA